jgi:hypothetical protein
VCSCVPIINSNAIVESLWSTLKRRYLRKHSRAKLEFLVDIIMNQYLPNLTMLITACRKGEKRPVWYALMCLLAYCRYNLFVKEWRKKCAIAKENFQNCEDKNQFYKEEWDNYGTTIENWWCGCPSYQTSANHLCKHLIARYIGHEGLESNKPPMPFYGEVWRQTVSPPLWISGLHNISKLTVRDLQPVPQEDLPILTPDHIRVDITDEIDDDGLEIEEAIYDTNDDNDDDDDSEGNDSDWEDIDSFSDGIVFDDDDFEDEETAVERMERELRGDEIKEKAELMARQLLRIVEELNKVPTYPSSHRYLSELPRIGIDNVLAWHHHTKRQDTVRSARTIRPTFARERIGNMFVG